MQFMSRTSILTMALVVALLMAGCASSKVTGISSQSGDRRLPKPNRILVYNFVASAEDIAKNAAVTGSYTPRATPQTQEEIGDLSRERESSEQFVWLNRRYGETETQLSRSAITPSIRVKMP